MVSRFLTAAIILNLFSSSAYSFDFEKIIDKVKERNGSDKYTAFNSSEAIMEFDGVLKYKFSQRPYRMTIEREINNQVDHMIGPMSFSSPTAVPKGNHKITNIKIATDRTGTSTITYHYKGTIALQNGPETTYNIYLPIDHSKIYSASMVRNENPCTDHHYQSEGDFWYFWSPDREGCKLKKDVDYQIIPAKIKRIKNMVKTYPEYHNLVDEKGNITIHILFGMDDIAKSGNPLISKDINAYNYREFRNYLLKNGYTATKWTETEISAIAKSVATSLPFVETIKKGKISYRFFFGPTGINESSSAFHWFYKDAIENSSVMIYEGHSGLGGHLDLESIESDLRDEINFNKKRYQIFFFDSCTSYKYYNEQYFARKMSDSDPKGTKKLDIFANGLSTAFAAMPRATAALAIAIEKAISKSVDKNKFTTYQEMARNIDSNNLFGINGDEDNELPRSLK